MSQDHKHQNGCCQKSACGPSGNAAVHVLLILVVAVLAFIAGKMLTLQQLSGSKNAASQMAATETSSQTTGDEKSTDPQTEAKTNVVSKDNPVVAKVGDKQITRQDVVDFMNLMPQNFRQIPQENLFPMALEQLINNEVIGNKVKGSNLENDEEVQKELSNAKDQIIRGKFVEREVKKAVTEDRIKEAYEEYKKNFPKTEEVKAAHILVDDENKAKEIIKKLDSGEDFAKLAKENSKDGTAETGGDLGYFAEGEVVPEFSKAAFATDKGSYTKKPVKSAFGYHIIKVEDKRTRPAADYATAKPYLEQELSRKVLDEVIGKWREEAKIERMDINGKPLTDQAKTEPQSGEAVEPAVEPSTGQSVESENAEKSSSPSKEPTEEKAADKKSD